MSLCEDFSVTGVLESPFGEAGKKRLKKARGLFSICVCHLVYIKGTGLQRRQPSKSLRVDVRR